MNPVIASSRKARSCFGEARKLGGHPIAFLDLRDDDLLQFGHDLGGAGGVVFGQVAGDAR